jgi:dihydrofolate reductase
MSKIFTSIAVSLDGYLASNSGDVSWLNDSMAKGEDYGFEETMKRTGIFIMGANSYKEMLKSGMAGGREHTYVITTAKNLKKGSHTYLYDGDLIELAEQVKSETEKDIYIWGGGSVITQFIDLNLLDELNIAVIPVLLGDGVPLFGRLNHLKKLRLTECRKFEKSGIALLKYELWIDLTP